MSVDEVVYLDSSAIVKLVVREAETDALLLHLEHHDVLVSSALARTEVDRAVLRHGKREHRTAQLVLQRLELLKITDDILSAAGRIEPASLRTLDAIHLASADAFGASLSHMICYDARLSEAAVAHGLSVTAPG